VTDFIGTGIDWALFVREIEGEEKSICEPSSEDVVHCCKLGA